MAITAGHAHPGGEQPWPQRRAQAGVDTSLYQARPRRDRNREPDISEIEQRQDGWLGQSSCRIPGLRSSPLSAMAAGAIRRNGFDVTRMKR